jgi:hypothetical protein
MPANPRSPNDSLTRASEPDTERLSQNGQLIGIAIYGGLVLVGFFFGIVTGYEKPVVVVKKDKEAPTPEPSKPEPPKVTPKVTPEPGPEPKIEPKKKDPESPKPEPKKIDPTPEPKKGDPSPPEPKKEVLQTVVFKDVLPVLKKHCTECHGAGKAQAGVDVTTIAKMMASKGKGRLLVPGKPDDSSLYTSIIDGEMPKDNRTTLTDKEKMLIHDWIKGGAKE